jgi:hypothetical protein
MRWGIKIMQEQHHKFSNGGHVVHRMTMPNSKCKFSVWYDNCGFLIDAERINKNQVSLPATDSQLAYFARHKPLCIRD